MILPVIVYWLADKELIQSRASLVLPRDDPGNQLSVAKAQAVKIPLQSPYSFILSVHIARVPRNFLETNLINAFEGKVLMTDNVFNA